MRYYPLMKTSTLFTATMTVILFCTATQAETLRWPMRIVTTSYTLHRMTGLTSNEKSKERASNMVIDASKTTRDGETYLYFLRKTKLTDETASDTSSASILHSKTPELSDALTKAGKEMNRPSSIDDSEETLFEDPDFTVKLVSQSRKRHLAITFGDGSEFALQPLHIQQFQTALRKLK